MRNYVATVKDTQAHISFEVYSKEFEFFESFWVLLGKYASQSHLLVTVGIET